MLYAARPARDFGIICFMSLGRSPSVERAELERLKCQASRARVLEGVKRRKRRAGRYAPVALKQNLLENSQRAILS